MRTESQSTPDRRASSPPDDRRRLTPVVVRALELGRGPPGLVRWLARHGANTRGDNVDRLAGELNHLVRTAGVTETLAE